MTENSCGLLLTIDEDVDLEMVDCLAEILERMEGIVSVDHVKDDFKHQAAVRKAQSKLKKGLSNLLSEDINLNGSPELNGSVDE